MWLQKLMRIRPGARRGSYILLAVVGHAQVLATRMEAKHVAWRLDGLGVILGLLYGLAGQTFFYRHWR